MSARVVHGDCIDVLRGMEAGSVSAICTDPPYGLSFMSKEFDRLGDGPAQQAWHERWAREALRVLKPGGHLLAFGGTRTHHRLMCAIEDAGFEVRDTLCWLHSQGFPKSADVSKAIDKAAGAEREVVGPDPYASNHPNPRGACVGQNYGTDMNPARHVTAPATDDARRWQGWGTALKPAWEPIVLARKPLDGTVAANVLRHGTGALNIDATRIATPGGSPSIARRGGPVDLGASMFRAEYARDEELYRRQRPGEQIGRFPPNVALSHSDGCERVGTRRVRTYWGKPGSYELDKGCGVTAMGKGKAQGPLHADADGKETVDDWRCVEGCAVAALDAQSGERGDHGTLLRGNRPTEASGAGMFGGGRKSEGNVYGDTGSASRFFFCAKAAASDRAFLCRTCDGRVYPSTERDRHRKHERVEHPTTKPIDLMRWLVRLVTPPGGLVCDPFAGSGSTGVACALEGVRFVGIEQDADYAAIARARIVDAAPLFARAAAEQRALFGEGEP